MSVAVCRNVFLFVISVNRNNTKSFLSASRLVTPSVQKGAHTHPVRGHLSSHMAQHMQDSPTDDVVLSQLLLKPGNVVFMATQTICSPCLKSMWRLQQRQDERLHLKAVVFLSESKANPACWGTHQRGLALLCHTNCDQLHAMVCKHSSS